MSKNNKIAYGRPSVSNGLHEKVVICTDAQSVKKISMAMIISQQMKEEGLNNTHMEELVLY